MRTNGREDAYVVDARVVDAGAEQVLASALGARAAESGRQVSFILGECKLLYPLRS